MRFTAFLISGALAAVATAQSATTTAAGPAGTSAAEICLGKCAKGDVNCQAHCITVPSPNDQNAIDTNKCAAKCVQGDGSPEQTKKYSDCVQGCIAQHFYVSSKGTPEATGGSGNNGGSGSGSGSDTTGTGASPTASGTDSGSGSQTTGSGTGTQTGTGAATTKTGAAAGLTVGSSGAFIGAVAALLAL